MTRDILKLAAGLGVRHQSYAPQLQKKLKELVAWNGFASDEDDEHEHMINMNGALATEELLFMEENAPGSVCEVRNTPKIAEIYSPPRVAALLPRDGLYPGISMDITTNDETGKPWDFDDPKQRQKAREQLRMDKPLVLVGSPMCTAFCRLQAINC